MTLPGLMEIGAAPPLEQLTEMTATEPHYLLALDEKGALSTFVHKQTRLGRVLVKVKDTAKVKPLNVPAYDTSGFLWKDIPPLPAEIIDQAWSFFADVFAKHHSEAIVLLTLDEQDRWHLHAPEQEVSHAGLDYTALKDLPEDEAIVGSIHSHADFSAFHSGTDETDSSKNDGLHITIGHVDTDKPSMDAMIAFSGTIWPRAVTVEALTGRNTVQRAEYPATWMDRVEKAQPAAYTYSYGTGYGTYGSSHKPNVVPRPGNPQTRRAYQGSSSGEEDWDLETWQAYAEYLESTDAEMPGWMERMLQGKTSDTPNAHVDDEPRHMGKWYSKDRIKAYEEAAHDLKELREYLLTRGINLRYRLKYVPKSHQ